MSPPASASSRSIPRWLAWGAFVVGTCLLATTLQTWLGQELLATSFVSPQTHAVLLAGLGATPVEDSSSNPLFDVPWSTVAGLVLVAELMVGGLGLLLLKSASASGLSGALVDRWVWILGRSAVGIGLWEWCWLPAVLIGGQTGAALMAALVPFWTALAIAGLVAGLMNLRAETAQPTGGHLPQGTPFDRRITRSLLVLTSIYTLCFVTLNWRLWFNLYLPHGDSAMYEEHLWNLLHGKGFRSYLDQGLFLGEHIQFVHLALLPLYILWPSQLLLELCESLALAAGVFPVAWMTWRHTQSRGAVISAAAAYLLYTPLQFLDIEIDLKTFRPEAFGIPLLLLTLDQLDRGRWKSFLGLLLACLTVKEDYAIIISPLGLWIAGTAFWNLRWPARVGADWPLAQRRWLITGLVLCLFGVVYLWLATRVLMPYFRPGQDIHYTSYFSRLGDSPEAILRTLITRPGFVAGEVLTLASLLYGLALLLPVGGLALLSPGRLAVGLPLFGILCLNELARDPRHHFHAPLVAIVFWATACGLGQFPTVWLWLARRRGIAAPAPAIMLQRGGRWLWSCSLATGLFFSLSPLGLSFWDPGSNWYWQRLYGTQPRGAAFATIAPLIPTSARVASTDFVHPRFTHHERSYDYSRFLRKVSGYELRVPDDTDYIVIDTTHPYSEYKQPTDVPEFHQTDLWELVPNDSGGVFIVLKRKTSAP